MYKMNINSLLDKSCSVIRQNWCSLDPDLDNDTYELVFEKCWKDWSKEYANPKVAMLIRDFAKDRSSSKLMLNKVSKKKRHLLHLTCENLGLEHASVDRYFDKNGYSIHNPKDQTRSHRQERVLVLKKRAEWRWEFTEGTDVIPIKAQQAKKRAKKQTKQARYESRMSNKECDACGSDGMECELMISLRHGGMYCYECLETETDEDGCPLGDSKWEPVY